jgi:hypothetical protein
MEVPMKRLNGLMALVAFLSFGTMSTFAFADDDKKEEKKDKGGQVVVLDGEMKDSKGSQVVLADDDKKDEKKDDKGGK